MTEAIATADADLAVERAVSDASLTMTELVQWFGSSVGAVSMVDALRQASFLICCDVIAQDLAKAPLRLMERLENGTARVVMPTRHPVAAMLADEPNRRHTWYEFSEMMGLWHALTSNNYALVRRNIYGEPVSLVPLMTSQVQVLTYETEVFYSITANTTQEAALIGDTWVRVPERDMIHVKARMFDGLMGLSTLYVGRTVLESGADLENYRQKIFKGQGAVRGVFTRDKDMGPMPELAFERFKRQLTALMNRFQTETVPIVLEGGIKFEAIANKPEEAELTKQLEAQILQTCRLLRIPPHKAFHLSNVKYENLDTMEKAYVGDTMVPICKRHEEQYAKRLLTRLERRRFFFEYDREALNLKDTRLETEKVKTLAERGIITRNEARARQGYNPVPGGDTFTLPVNAMLLDQANVIVVSAAQDAAEAAAEHAPDPAEQPADAA